MTLFRFATETELAIITSHLLMCTGKLRWPRFFLTRPSLPWTLISFSNILDFLISKGKNAGYIERITLEYESTLQNKTNGCDQG